MSAVLTDSRVLARLREVRGLEDPGKTGVDKDCVKVRPLRRALPRKSLEGREALWARDRGVGNFDGSDFRPDAIS